MSAPAKPRRRITPSRSTTPHVPPAGLRVVDVSTTQTPTRAVPSRDCDTGGLQVDGHAIVVNQQAMAVGGYFRSHCSCGEFVSRPCGTAEIAAEKADRHLAEVAKRQSE